MTAPGSGLALLLAALALAAGADGWTLAVAGIGTRDLVALLLLASGALLLTGWAIGRARQDWRDAPGVLAMWAVFVVSLASLYANREAAYEGLLAIMEDAGISRPAIAEVTGAGEVVVQRRSGGTFEVPVSLGGGPARPFLFDTGATSLVLTAATARELGFREENLRFRVPVSTANGQTLAAPVTVDRLAIGPIVMERVPALVSRAGQLRDNLLGGSVLDRLESFEVRGGRLILRAKRA